MVNLEAKALSEHFYKRRCHPEIAVPAMMFVLANLITTEVGKDDPAELQEGLAATFSDLQRALDIVCDGLGWRRTIEAPSIKILVKEHEMAAAKNQRKH